ncbi:SHOCT domain-containing protein [Citricoccus sp.]|uniref:SHOCT domain-containing protein n=1 Tax=Citricoccus sp. TaxID=1978372 RepID=UPI0028BF0A1F|nr:SHOCT domain-containing protein [Citricoccus sp.]
MPLRRVGRPGLLGLAARTAVVAGTAQAVSGRVAGNQRNRAQAQFDQEQYAAAQQQARIDSAAQAAASPAAPAATTAPPSAVGATDILDQLQRLAELKQSGLLTDEEFAAAKAKLLG